MPELIECIDASWRPFTNLWNPIPGERCNHHRPELGVEGRRHREAVLGEGVQRLPGAMRHSGVGVAAPPHGAPPRQRRRGSSRGVDLLSHNEFNVINATL